jgi:hypothetical protein
MSIALLLPPACSDDQVTSTSTATSGTPSGSQSSASATTTSAGGSMGVGAMGGAAGMAAGGMGGAPDPDDCDTCTEPLVEQNGACQMQTDACLGDVGCQAWLDCYQGCFDSDYTPPCFAACDSTHMGAAAIYGPVLTCVCGPCAQACAPLCG